MLNFILDKIPVGVISFDREMGVLYRNKQAEKFIKRYRLPPEIPNISGRMFDAIDKSQLQELFPGEIFIIRRLEGSQSNWTFRLHASEGPEPYVSVFIIEDAVANKLDLNRIRAQFKLTRRETDILRRVINGLSNKDIAEDLEITEQTVKDHLSNIYMKLEIKNRFALVRFLLDSPELHVE